MFALRLLLCIGLLGNVVACGNSDTETQDEIAEQIQLQSGVLSLVRGEQDNFDRLALDGEIVVTRESEQLRIFNTFMHGNQDIVLFGSHCGGTACATDNLAFLVLQKDQRPMLVEHEELYAYAKDIKAEQQAEGITVYLGYSGGQARYADLSGSELSFRLEAPKEKVLRDDLCEWLYNDGLKACVSAKETNNSCENPQIEFVGYVMRGLQAISEHPGFISTGFDQRCAQACQQSDIGNYESFSQEVCSIGLVQATN